jgi:hypothetical protein
MVLPGVIVYLIGTPAFFVGCLWYHNHHGTLDHPVNEDKYSFLFLKFKQEYWFMESYMLLVKFSLIGIIMYVLKGSATQVTISILFAMVFLIVSLNTAPYKNNDMNQGETITRSATLVTLFCALLIKVKLATIDEWSEGVLNGILMFVNVIVFVVFIYRFIRVQGLFLCENYFPDVCAGVCFKCFQWCGWRSDPTQGAKEDVDEEEEPMLSVISLRNPASYQEQTFKCVS